MRAAHCRLRRHRRLGRGIVHAGQAKVLKGTVGPGFTISVKTPAGKPVKTTKAGIYRSPSSRTSLGSTLPPDGPGVNKVVTTVPIRWERSRSTVRLKAGHYRYCAIRTRPK